MEHNKRPILKDGRWHCPYDWSVSGRAIPLHGTDCSCGYKCPEWAIDYDVAFRLALKQLRDDEFETVESCCQCSSPDDIRGLAICLDCGAETCFGHRVDVTRYKEHFINGDNLSQIQVEPDPRLHSNETLKKLGTYPILNL